jgi:DnaJ-like protein/PilZ domain-containing protein
MQSSVTERRRHPRRKSFQAQPELKLRFQDADDLVDLSAKVKDVSETGLGLETIRPIAKGTRIAVTGDLMSGIRVRRLEAVTGLVVSSVRVRESIYAIGIAFDGGTAKPSEDQQDSSADDKPAVDYYEVMQLNPNAEPDTIHRVYRLLAQRYHPDNQETGNRHQFQALLDAYKVLSDPEQRAAYDVARERHQRVRWKVFDQSQAKVGPAAERQKRQGILSLLYTARMRQPNQPGMFISDIEELIGCPREHLEFSLWYLKEVGCIVRGDNSRFLITVKGVEWAEEGRFLPGNRLVTAAEES